MKKESILFTVIALLVGLLIAGTIAVLAVNNDNHSIMGMMGMETNHSHTQEATSHGEMSMSEMADQLETKSGVEFDKAFIEMMIDHHQGAIDMAVLIPSRTKHNELIQLGEAIVNAQTEEIGNMRQWQKDWGYSQDETMQMMHGGH